MDQSHQQKPEDNNNIPKAASIHQMNMNQLAQMQQQLMMPNTGYGMMRPAAMSPMYAPQMMMRPSQMPIPVSSPRISVLPADQRAALLAAFNNHPEVAKLRAWLNDAPKLMAQEGLGPVFSYNLKATQETISCVFWKGKYFITGTDIVKILKFRFACIGKPIGNLKKFEEGVFSDLRNLKAGEHASLEEPKSEFLEFLYKHNCIRTQKKQKVFYWYEVRHDDLVVEAFERDAKRHNTATTINNFLQAQNNRLMMGGNPMAPGAPRLMPRTPAMPYYTTQSVVTHELPLQDEDPGLAFLNSHDLQDNLLLAEPIPKSPRLCTSPVSSPKALDPSLLSALPAKDQRKVQAQARANQTPNIPAGESCNSLAASSLGLGVVNAKDLKGPAAEDEVKDPLLQQDLFNFDSASNGLDTTGLYDFYFGDSSIF